VTKPTAIGVGVAVSAAGCLALAVVTSGVARVWWTWTTVACVVAATAYLRNAPAWLGKRDGRWSWRALVVLPYLVAFRIACTLMRWWRGSDEPTRVAPGLWVGGRIAGPLPAGVTHVVDLVAEYPEHGRITTMTGYRSLPTLDGGYPPSMADALALVEELATFDGDVLVHCDSGRGRAPTFAAALLIARGLADDVDGAIALLRRTRPVTRPTRSDRAFLADALPDLVVIARTRLTWRSPEWRRSGSPADR
jgi:protein-tyrosine phosphatase